MRKTGAENKQEISPKSRQAEAFFRRGPPGQPVAFITRPPVLSEGIAYIS